ncbi:hypothetical protein AAFF_G00180660 [Aldrovandia affinis]|uniref:Uncharacterized protein n=1 Tax=Aldrovandia affinis TaxID=143900 RepID=A0AAD7SYE8_9TELE|nr:hypothetical protein AAFF_G00180660 [Aldrovandia affinis]
MRRDAFQAGWQQLAHMCSRVRSPGAPPEPRHRTGQRATVDLPVKNDLTARWRRSSGWRRFLTDARVLGTASPHPHLTAICGHRVPWGEGGGDRDADVWLSRPSIATR